MMQDVAKQAEKAKTFTPGAPAAAEQKLTDEHRAIYADRIAKATTVEEVSTPARVGVVVDVVVVVVVVVVVAGMTGVDVDEFL